MDRSTNGSVWTDLAGLGIKIVVIVAAFTLVFTVVFGLARTTDPGMSPAVKDGDVALFSRFGKSYRVGDLVVLVHSGQREIRRVVAIAGDTVDITTDGLFVNHCLQQEPTIYEPTRRYADGIDFPVTIGDGQVFVLGDARDNATDSRVYGAVDEKQTLGKVIALLRRRSL
jgi:signal peptidase I